MKRIVIARAVRHWPGAVAEATLVWNVSHSKLMVEYRQEHREFGGHYEEPPDHCVVHWLRHFVRPQNQLQSDSYYITEGPCAAWREIIEGILKSR